MRIRRLDLTRYGRFTDLSLDFGEPGEGPDLHLVYGANEAGKSTVFTAFLDLLYGIHPQSPYNFLHPYPAMRIGAALDIGGTVREFVRIKRPANSLLDVDGRPMAESSIQTELGGVGRDAYRSMFSLDDDSLEAGGKSILDSRGDLGELLFAATSGLAELSRRLGDVEAKAGTFYRYRANQGELPTLKARLVDLKTQREAIDTIASKYRGLVETRDRAAEAYDEAVRARGSLQAGLDRVVASLGTLPRLAALRVARAELAPLRSLPEAPRGWLDEVPKLQGETVRLATLARTVSGEIERLRGEIAKIDQDERPLLLAERVKLLVASQARALTARKDLPERRLSLRAIDATIEGILSRLDRIGEPDVPRLVLGAADVGRLQTLIEARSGLDAALILAGEEHAGAVRRLAEAQAKVEEGRGETAKPKAAMIALPRALKVARASDHAMRARTAERAVAKASRALEDGMGGLLPFRGSVDDLQAVDVPDVDVVRAWRERMAELDATRLKLVKDRTACERELGRLAAERDAITASSGSVAEDPTAGLRTIRERAWADHRTRLDSESADIFEDAMRHDDAAGDRRLSDVADRERLRTIGLAITTTVFDRNAATAQSDALDTALDAAREEATTAWRGAMRSDHGLVCDLRDFERWIERRASLLKLRSTLIDGRTDLREASDDGAAACRDLRQALSDAAIAFGTGDGFATLIEIGQDALDAETRRAALRSTVADCERDLEVRAAASALATTRDLDWKHRWSEACAACWLGEEGAEPELGSVREALAALVPLGPALESRAALDDRITKMARDLEAFAGEAADYAGAIGEPAGDDAFEVAGRVAARVADAVRRSDDRRRLEGELDTALGRQRELAGETLVVADRIEGMSAYYGVADLTMVADRLRDVERRAILDDDVRATEREILDRLGLVEIGDAETLLDAADRDALERERAELRIRLEDEDRRCHELFAVCSTASAAVAAIGADEAVASIEERRRTTLMQIEDGAVRYIRLKAGIVAMEHALRLHRDRSRGTMITEASDAFSTMSRGAYTGLATQPHKDRETLIAVGRAGGSKAADQLSKGTRFQLYLSLRVAGYLEFARNRPAVPFVGDDIMESFDDFRAEETLKLFMRMAGVGQVVYFTHHRHLIPIAREVCPAIRIHELSGAEATAA